jgi:hypothetical protein
MNNMRNLILQKLRSKKGISKTESGSINHMNLNLPTGGCTRRMELHVLIKRTDRPLCGINANIKKKSKLRIEILTKAFKEIKM